MNDLLGVKELFDHEDFWKLLLRGLINLLFAGVVIQRYSKIYKENEYRFTYYLFNIITFALCFLLRKVPIELGFALGLFAVFGILRYRTEPIGIRNLTYLFVVIGIAILNAVANKKVSLAELLLVNVAIAGATLVLEWSPRGGRTSTHEMLYDDLEKLRPGNEEALHDDIATRTGLAVERVDVLRFDLLRDTATINVTYRQTPSGKATGEANGRNAKSTP